MTGLYEWMRFLAVLGVNNIKAFLAAEDRRAFVVDAARAFYVQVVEPIDLPGPDKFIDPLLLEATGVLAGRLYDGLMKLFPDVLDKLAASPGAVDELLASYHKFESQANGVS